VRIRINKDEISTTNEEGSTNSSACGQEEPSKGGDGYDEDRVNAILQKYAKQTKIYSEEGTEKRAEPAVKKETEEVNKKEENEKKEEPIGEE